MYKKYSDQWFVDLYFKHGSVEEALNSNENYLPISPATFHRKLNKFGIIPSAGRHSSFSEMLTFFKLKAEEHNMPLKKIYNKMPYSFQTSLVTMHRILNSVENRIIRREATVLLISDPNDRNKLLVANELLSNDRYSKKAGDVTAPTGFSKRNENHKDSVLRVLQNEFSCRLSIENKLEKTFNLNDLTPFMHIYLLDVKIKVFHLVCPKELSDLSNVNSYKLSDFRFEDTKEIKNLPNLRVGAEEILNGYQRYLKGEDQIEIVSDINYQLINKASNLQLA